MRLKRLTFSNRGIGIKVAFSLSRVGKRIHWAQSKRLITGSLVVLIPFETNNYNVNNAKVAIVAARPISDLEQDPPQLDLFLARPEELEIDCQKKWIMLEERSGFFEAERHTLVALQKMVHEKTPLTEHFLAAKKGVDAPRYLQEQPGRNLRPVFGAPSIPQPFRTDVLNDWPADPQTQMDTTQQQASLPNLVNFFQAFN